MGTYILFMVLSHKHISVMHTEKIPSEIQCKAAAKAFVKNAPLQGKRATAKAWCVKL